MSIVRNIFAFSKNGEYLAYSSPDGCLKIWESSTGILKQEYTPSSHLSATCSSLSWGPIPYNKHESKKAKMQKSKSLYTLSNLQLIAVGTRTGDILLYSFVNADLYTCFNNGHTDVVNDVAWYNEVLYSCSNDSHLICWSANSGKIKMKWKNENGGIYSVCAVDDNNILFASTSIQLFDVSKKNIIKTFSGHGSEIFRLLPVQLNDCNYFLSAAVGDRIINLWQLDDTRNKRALASFVLSDEPTSINVQVNKENPLQISVVSQDGLFHFFEHTLNGKLKKPLQSKFTVQIASKSSDTKKASSLPILASSITEDLNDCLLSYGSFLKPVFERIDFSNISENVFLIRDVSKFLSVPEENITKVKKPDKPNNVKLLAPGHMSNVSFPEKNLKKRKKEAANNKEVPMEEKLKALDLNKTPKEMLEHELTVRADSMVHLLLQGLQSKDNNILVKVLSCNDESIINNTLKRVPIQSILPLLQVLYERLNKREPRGHPCLKWFTTLLTLHLPYFMSCRDISEYLIPFDQLISARKEVVYKMSQAQGILKLLMAQTLSSPSNGADLPKPLLEYESDSSEEEEDKMNCSDNESENEIIHHSSASSSENSDSESEMDD